MALINSGEAQNEREFTSVSALTRTIRMALAEELAAVNTYDRIADSIALMGSEEEMAGIDDDEHLSAAEIANLIVELDEIRKDELEHQGKLLAILARLDESGERHVELGRTGV